ncbi:forkhead box protein N2-like [Mustelus asterias]
MERGWLHLGQRASSPAPCPRGDPEPSCCTREAREDQELTNLNWLHESKNLLTALRLAGEAPVAQEIPASPSHTLQLPQDISRPPYPFNCLIFMAIEGSPSRCLPLKEIYQWILQNYPYFQRAPLGWRNAVRHNLSLNSCFRRVQDDGREAVGKGSYWCVDERSRPNLLQAIRKRTLNIHSSPLGSSDTGVPDTPYTQDTDGELEEQLSIANEEPGVTVALSDEGISGTDNKEPTLINSWQLPFIPLRVDSCLSHRTPAPGAVPSGDHNYSLAWAEGWELCPAVPSDRERPGTLSVKAASDQGGEDSEGFLSADEWEMEDSLEEEGEEDSLADSGYVPLSRRDAPCAEGSEGRLRSRSWEQLGFSDIDEELKEVAGSLLHLAGVCS